MSSVCTETKREGEVLYVRIFNHFNEPVNFRVDFKEKIIQYKDGFSFKGWWKDVETKDFIGVLENEHATKKTNKK